MNLDRSLFAAFKPIKQPDETIYWAGRPNFLCYLAQGVPALAFGAIWFTIWYWVVRGVFSSGDLFSLIFSLGFLLPSWGTLFNLIGIVFSYQKTVYAITDRRILIREGSLSVVFASIDFSRITEVRVTQNPLGAAMGLGTVSIYVSGTLKDGTNHESFRGINDPHEVCRKLTEISVSPIAVV